MRTLRFFTFTLIVLGIFALYEKGTSNSSGALPENTGAPGETTCAQSSCHNDFNLNAGSGRLKIEPLYQGQPVSTYGNSVVYTIKLTLTDQNMNAAGFQIIAKRTDNNNIVGEFKVGDKMKKTGANNNYLTHTQPATSFESNSQIWTIQWTSPNQDVGEIKFYAAANAANNDNTNNGDYIYSADTSMTFDATSGVENPGLANATEIYPNPTNGSVNIELPNKLNQEIHISLYNMKGQQIQTINKTEVNNDKIHMSLPPEIKPGIYMLQLESQDQQSAKRLLVQ